MKTCTFLIRKTIEELITVNVETENELLVKAGKLEYYQEFNLPKKEFLLLDDQIYEVDTVNVQIEKTYYAE